MQEHAIWGEILVRLALHLVTCALDRISTQMKLLSYDSLRSDQSLLKSNIVHSVCILTPVE
jgi:hypothetical protein